jgi:hypothetical protein
MPVIMPDGVTTGRPLIDPLSMSFAASATVASELTVVTRRVMTSATFMACRSFRNVEKHATVVEGMP